MDVFFYVLGVIFALILGMVVIVALFDALIQAVASRCDAKLKHRNQGLEQSIEKLREDNERLRRKLDDRAAL